MRLHAEPRRRLQQLLALRNAAVRAAHEIDVEIQAHFRRQAAILVIDLSGFTAGTDDHGIIGYLATIHRMVQVVTPVVRENGGRVLKQDADNLFALFKHPADAVEAALDARRVTRAVNNLLGVAQQVNLCLGIGYGDLLVIEPDDAWGAEMNHACKLGEDLAGPGEILLTPAAAAAIAPARHWRVVEQPPRRGLGLYRVESDQ